MSLRIKIAVALAVLAGIIAAMASAGAYVSARRQLDRSINETLITRARAAVSQPYRGPRGPQDGRPATGGLRCPEVAELQSLTAAQILVDDDVVACITGGATITPTAADLAIAAGTDAPADGADDIDVERSGDRDGGDDDDPGRGVTSSTTGSTTVRYRLSDARVAGEDARVITMAYPGGGAIQLARDTDEADRVLGRLAVQLLLIALAGIVVAAGVGFVLATRIVAPIRRLTRTAQHIAETRDLTTDVPTLGRDEIGSLSTSFTTMVRSLAASQEQQQRLISDASHEMRTPLTSLRTNLELLERAEAAAPGSLSADDRRAIIDDLQFETSELTALLTELVELATDRSSAEPPEAVDLVALCDGVAERARRRTGREVTVTSASGAATVTARAHLVERAVANLVDNAVKYAESSSIEIVVDGGRIEVRDHGPGVAADDRPRVFDRFYRATTARTAPGSGLGLAIVAQIVEAHGGRVFVEDRADGERGAVVGFELPT